MTKLVGRLFRDDNFRPLRFYLFLLKLLQNYFIKKDLVLKMNNFEFNHTVNKSIEVMCCIDIITQGFVNSKLIKSNFI